MKTIGIDIDDTITKTSNGIRDYIINHRNEFEDADQLLKDIKYILSGNRISNDTTKFLNDIYPDVIEKVELREDILNVLNKLKKDGHKVILITAREDAYFPCGAELITLEYLKRHNVPYDILITHSVNKKRACIDNTIDIMIDDSISTCELLQEIGIRTLLFNTDINKDIKTNILRVSNWLEIYNIIGSESNN